MSHSPVHHKIMELRQRSMLRTTEAIMVIFAAIISIAILPTLLLRYMYDATQLLEQPKALEYIPLVSVIVAAIYFFRALVGNIKREKEVKRLMMEMEMMSDDCCGGGKCGSGKSSSDDEDEDWDEDLKELEELLAEVEAEEAAEKKTTTSKGASKKKDTKKKTATKGISKKSSKK